MILPSILCLFALATPTFALPPRLKALYPRATSTGSCPAPSTVTVTVTSYVPTPQTSTTSSSASQSSPTASSNYVSLGCILDDSSRVMNQSRTSVRSVDDCARIGKASGRRYFGLENGSECYVADVLSKNVPTTGCNAPCPSGTSSGGCGGTWRINLYEFAPSSTISVSASGSSAPSSSTATTSLPPSSPSGYTYQGCIADSSSRAMNQTWTSTSSMTIAQCAGIAQTANRRYFGLQNGQECFISDVLASQTVSTGCTVKCRGDQTAICGGSWAISLYSWDDKSAGTSTRITISPTTSFPSTPAFSQYSTCSAATSTVAPAPTGTATVCFDYLCPPRENAAVRPAIEAAYDEASNRISCR